MKVLIINKSASGGGAAVAANRLFHALKSQGTEVKMLVQDTIKTSGNQSCTSKDSIGGRHAFFRFVMERLYFLPFEKDKTIRFGFSPANTGIDISQHPWVQEADIIHLHWTNQGFLSLKSLAGIFKLNKPVVWTLHDMWAFTGGCHYSGSCSEYVESCGTCPYLRNPGSKDLSFQVHKKKKKIWKQANITAVSCSKWLGSLARESSLLRNHRIHSIPNPIDTNLFKPLVQSKCRDELGLPKNKKLILFGAANVNDPRKGIIFLIRALEMLDVQHPNLSDEVELVVFGKCKKSSFETLPYKIHSLKFISDVHDIVKVYNAANVFVLPSLQDNLPNTVMEAMSCGVPVVSFRIGGVPEMVAHGENGFLADVKNSYHLAEGIYEIISHKNPNQLRELNRNLVLERYDYKVVAEQYQHIYSSLVYV